MRTIHVFLVICFHVWVCGSTAVDTDMSALLQRMASLEEKVSRQAELESRIEVLEAEMMEKDQRISELQQQCTDAYQLRKPIQDGEDNTGDFDKDDTKVSVGQDTLLKDKVGEANTGRSTGISSFQEKGADNATVSRIESDVYKSIQKVPTHFISKTKKRSLIETPVAFTANLELPDHHEDHIGMGQTIKFNKIITNSGSSYNKHSGVFTAPVEGIYLFSFSFSVGWAAEHAGLQLMVDSVPQVGGVATSTTYGMDVQGGNVAIVHLTPGQVVRIESFMINDIRLFATAGFSSFSGVLLYQF